MEKLHERRAMWLRYGGGDSVARRRRSRALTQSRRGWYKQASGTTTLPSRAAAADHTDVWTPATFEDVKVVFFPAPDTGALSEGGDVALVSSRKRLRRGMRTIREVDGVDLYEFLSSRRASRPGSPAIGRAQVYRHTVVRALYLESIGAAIVPGLSEAKVEILEDAGAIVLDNDIAAIIDPEASEQAHIDGANVGAHLWHLAGINVESARKHKLDGTGVTIGVLDTGIDADHPEFSGKSVIFRSFSADGQMRRLHKAKDYETHGTHVSALCAGSTVGVAPKANLAVAAVLTARDGAGRMVGYTAQILAGLNWLAQAGDGLSEPVDVVNASLGGSNASASYYMAVASHRLGGTLVVAAIGNQGELGFGRHSAPAMFDCVIGVGAVAANDSVPTFSAWGQTYCHPAVHTGHKPDLMAPGVGVVSAIPGVKYAAKNGTSMACPLVSGAVALVIQQNATLRANPDAVTDRIYSLTRAFPAADTKTDPRRHGRGCLDLSKI